MTVCINIITHLTEKKVIVCHTNGSIMNESTSNTCISAPYDSYIVYMSNPVSPSNFLNLLTQIDNTFTQMFIFAFTVIIIYLFYVFLMVIKKKGFNGVR